MHRFRRSSSIFPQGDDAAHRSNPLLDLDSSYSRSTISTATPSVMSEPQRPSRMRGMFSRRNHSSGSTSTFFSNASSVSGLSSFVDLNLKDGDKPTPFPPGYKINPLEVRDLNELIRKRYAYDLEIWRLRTCPASDRHIVLDKMRRADALLKKILETVRMWDKEEIWSVRDDYEKIKLIRRKLGDDLESGGKRFWGTRGPWEDHE